MADQQENSRMPATAVLPEGTRPRIDTRPKRLGTGDCNLADSSKAHCRKHYRREGYHAQQQYCCTRWYLIVSPRTDCQSYNSTPISNHDLDARKSFEPRRHSALWAGERFLAPLLGMDISPSMPSFPPKVVPWSHPRRGFRAAKMHLLSATGDQSGN